MNFGLRLFTLVLFFVIINFTLPLLCQTNQFPVGAYISDNGQKYRYNSSAYNSVNSSGMNTFVQYADSFASRYKGEMNLALQMRTI